MKDYYAILGLDQDASVESIKVAYRRLARENHPDRVLHLGKEAIAQASGRMADLNEAYSVLSDARQRQEYDLKYVAQTVAVEEAGPGGVPEEAPPVVTPARQRARPATDVLSSVVRQFSHQLHKDLVNQKAFAWQQRRFEGFEWALQSSTWLSSYWAALRGFPTADRAAVQKYVNYANLAIDQNKSWLRANHFLFLLPFQRLSDAENVVGQCQRFAQGAGSSAVRRAQTVVVLFDVSRGQSRVCGARSRDKRFLQLLQSLRLSSS